MTWMISTFLLQQFLGPLDLKYNRLIGIYKQKDNKYLNNSNLIFMKFILIWVENRNAKMAIYNLRKTDILLTVRQKGQKW